ncbi:hypothetical protein GCM10022261_08520 [Brevibacterium daeguense]|uniref:Uncharacterized protein n=1 Tax=Brevibacterium daeguense TaxID=909936 RepID=A0ABP8EHG9_9MICO
MKGKDGRDEVGRYWRKHPNKELEALLEEFHEAGWQIINPKKKYYKVRCPCGSHYRSIHISPSNPRYSQDALSWLYRQPCYSERGHGQ